MSTVFGAPLVGKLFTPVMFVFTVMYIVVALARWLQGDKSKSKTSIVDQPSVPEKPPLDPQPDLTTESGTKKKKKKKSCCGTKGSCCKTKKESGEEAAEGCGCGCSSKKEKKEGDAESCSSDEGSDSESAPVLDVEELGIMAEGLRPDLATHSPPRPPRTGGAVKGRVRLRVMSDQAKNKTAASEVELTSSQT